MTPRKPAVPGTGTKSARVRRRLNAVPEVFDPAYEAWKLRQQGLAWIEVAKQTGYATTPAAKLAVSTFLQQANLERATEQRAEALQLSIDRYEAVINAYWSAAVTERKAEAAAVILRAMAQSDRVQRLAEDEISVTAPRTIVIAGTPEAYVAKLQAVVEGGDPDAIPKDLR